MRTSRQRKGSAHGLVLPQEKVWGTAVDEDSAPHSARRKFQVEQLPGDLAFFSQMPPPVYLSLWNTQGYTHPGA
jgi:hypothetical protein